MKLKNLAIGSLVLLSGYASANGIEGKTDITNPVQRSEFTTRYSLRESLDQGAPTSPAQPRYYFKNSSRVKIVDESPELEHSLSPHSSLSVFVGTKKGTYSKRLSQIFRDKPITVRFTYKWANKIPKRSRQD